MCYYLPALLFTSKPTRGYCWFGNYLVSSGCTYGLDTVSFHSIRFEVYFTAVSAQGFARPLAGLLATHLAIVYSVYSAYLPGLPLRVPRRLWKVTESNRLLIRGFLMSPPRGRTAVAFLRTVFILFQSCRFAPLFRLFLPLFFVSLCHSDLTPDRLLLVKSHHSASQFHDFARCNHPLYLMFRVG